MGDSILDDSLAAAPALNEKPAHTEEPMERVALEIIAILSTSPTYFVENNLSLQSKLGQVAVVDDDADTGFLGPQTGAISRKVNIKLTPSMAAAEIYLRASQALESVPPSIIRPLLNEALSVKLPVINQLWIVSSLMEIGDFNQVETLLEPLLAAATPSLRSGIGAFTMSLQVGYRKSPSVSVVPFLGRLLSSNNVVVRRAAAAALTNASAQYAVQPLATTAINDPDSGVRFFAETGLCRLTHVHDAPCNLPLGPAGSDKLNEGAYRAYWTDWARKGLTAH